MDESYQCPRPKDFCSTYKTYARVKIHSRRLAVFFHMARFAIVIACIIHIVYGKLYLVYLDTVGDSNIFSSGIDTMQDDNSSRIFCDPQRNGIYEFYWSESWQYKNFLCPTTTTSQFIFKPRRGQFFASTHISASFINQAGNISHPRSPEEWFIRGVDGMSISIEHTALVRTDSSASAELELHYMPALKIEDRDGNVFKEYFAGEWPSLTVKEMLILAGIQDGLDQENPSCGTTVDEVPYGSDYCTYRLSGLPVVLELYYSNSDHLAFGTGDVKGTLRVFKLDGWSSNTGGAVFDTYTYDGDEERVEAVANYHYGLYIQTVQKGAFGVFHFSSFLIVVVSYVVLVGIATTLADFVIGLGLCCALSKDFNTKIYAVEISETHEELLAAIGDAHTLFDKGGAVPERVDKAIHEHYKHMVDPEAHLHQIIKAHYGHKLKRAAHADPSGLEEHVHLYMKKHRHRHRHRKHRRRHKHHRNQTMAGSSFGPSDEKLLEALKEAVKQRELEQLQQKKNLAALRKAVKQRELKKLQQERAARHRELDKARHELHKKHKAAAVEAAALRKRLAEMEAHQAELKAHGGELQKRHAALMEASEEQGGDQIKVKDPSQRVSRRKGRRSHQSARASDGGQSRRRKRRRPRRMPKRIPQGTISPLSDNADESHDFQDATLRVASLLSPKGGGGHGTAGPIHSGLIPLEVDFHHRHGLGNDHVL